jgi:hypothetical protein
LFASTTWVGYVTIGYVTIVAPMYCRTYVVEGGDQMLIKVYKTLLVNKTIYIYINLPNMSALLSTSINQTNKPTTTQWQCNATATVQNVVLSAVILSATVNATE